jgi:hypothetical protein
VGALLVYIAATFTYQFLFHPNTSEPYTATVGGTLFTRTYLPDSVLYEQDQSFSKITVDEMLSNLGDERTNPNMFGISMLASILREVGLDPIYANMVLVALAGLFFVLICNTYGISSTGPLVLLFLNPSTVYYSQTATKEIVTLFAGALFVLVIVTTRGTRRVIGAVPAMLLTFAFRVQTAIPMLIALAVSHASFFTKRRTCLWAFVTISLVLPLLYRSEILGTDSMMLYRQDTPSVTGLAEYIDAGLQRIPLAGLVLLPVRAFQNATEPFPTVSFRDYEYSANAVNLHWLVLFATVLLSWFFTSEFVRVLWRVIVRRKSGPENLDSIVLYAGLFWLMVATNPFVHGRYLFNILPVFALVGAISRAPTPQDPAEPSTGAPERRSTVPSWLGWCALMVVWGARFLLQL